MATLTTEKPVETLLVFPHGSSAPPHLLEEEPTTQVERRDAPAVSTIKEPAVITFQKIQLLPETKAGFLSRMLRRLRDTAFEVGIANRGRPSYRDSQALSQKEKSELDAFTLGFFRF